LGVLDDHQKQEKMMNNGAFIALIGVSLFTFIWIISSERVVKWLQSLPKTGKGPEPNDHLKLRKTLFAITVPLTILMIVGGTYMALNPLEVSVQNKNHR
jgi:hypothetical protein